MNNNDPMQPEDLLHNVSRESSEKLEIYHKLLLKWQKAINLVSGRTLNQAWERHFLDSVQIAQYIGPSTKVVADIGSGGGFPGLVLAIIRPDLQIHLIESDERKCQFLKAVSRETDTDVDVRATRVEDMEDDFTPDCVTARALADLPTLLSFCVPWAKRNPHLEAVLMKGAKAEEELNAARAMYGFECDTHRSATDPQGRVLYIHKMSSNLRTA